MKSFLFITLCLSLILFDQSLADGNDKNTLHRYIRFLPGAFIAEELTRAQLEPAVEFAKGFFVRAKSTEAIMNSLQLQSSIFRCLNFPMDSSNALAKRLEHHNQQSLAEFGIYVPTEDTTLVPKWTVKPFCAEPVEHSDNASAQHLLFFPTTYREPVLRFQDDSDGKSLVIMPATPIHVPPSLFDELKPQARNNLQSFTVYEKMLRKPEGEYAVKVNTWEELAGSSIILVDFMTDSFEKIYHDVSLRFNSDCGFVGIQPIALLNDTFYAKRALDTDWKIYPLPDLHFENNSTNAYTMEVNWKAGFVLLPTLVDAFPVYFPPQEFTDIRFHMSEYQVGVETALGHSVRLPISRNFNYSAYAIILKKSDCFIQKNSISGGVVDQIKLYKVITGQFGEGTTDAAVDSSTAAAEEGDKKEETSTQDESDTADSSGNNALKFTINSIFTKTKFTDFCKLTTLASDLIAPPRPPPKKLVREQFKYGAKKEKSFWRSKMIHAYYGYMIGMFAGLFLGTVLAIVLRRPLYRVDEETGDESVPSRSTEEAAAAGKSLEATTVDVQQANNSKLASAETVGQTLGKIMGKKKNQKKKAAPADEDASLAKSKQLSFVNMPEDTVATEESANRSVQGDGKSTEMAKQQKGKSKEPKTLAKSQEGVSTNVNVTENAGRTRI